MRCTPLPINPLEKPSGLVKLWHPGEASALVTEPILTSASLTQRCRNCYIDTVVFPSVKKKMKLTVSDKIRNRKYKAKETLHFKRKGAKATHGESGKYVQLNNTPNISKLRKRVCSYLHPL